MTSDPKLPIPTYYADDVTPKVFHRLHDGTGLYCMTADVRELVERMEKAEAQRDRLAELLRRTMTDTACVEVDGPGCWFCDRDDGAHTDGCEAAEALADIEKENA